MAVSLIETILGMKPAPGEVNIHRNGGRSEAAVNLAAGITVVTCIKDWVGTA